VKGEWHLEFTFEKIVVDIERTPFAVEVILGTSDDQNSGWERRNVRKSSFQTSSRARRGYEAGQSRRCGPFMSHTNVSPPGADFPPCTRDPWLRLPWPWPQSQTGRTITCSAPKSSSWVNRGPSFPLSPACYLSHPCLVQERKDFHPAVPFQRRTRETNLFSRTYISNN